ncbi:MAG: hypothetical protein K2P81_02020 [Bacteriovoracaceae bacterium]|nr:hypothetical protein [Bacteriovoracaceae bacterium]
MGFRFFILLFLFSCATKAPKDPAFESLWKFVSMDGEGKARLEVGPESWVFSFESLFINNGWKMAISIPLKGEEIFDFPELNETRPTAIPEQNDFRWRIVDALRVASTKRKLNYPQLGQDFVLYLHHLLRWTHSDQLSLTRNCVLQSANNWDCKWDEVISTWSWDEKKEEFTGVIKIKPTWSMRVVFKNLTDSFFKRVTIEVIHKLEFSDQVELRQELFFSHH